MDGSTVLLKETNQRETFSYSQLYLYFSSFFEQREEGFFCPPFFLFKDNGVSQVCYYVYSNLRIMIPAGKSHPDRRHEWTRVIFTKVRELCLPHNLKKDPRCQRRATLVRAAVAVALYPMPLRTAHMALKIEGVGNSILKLLQNNEAKAAIGGKSRSKQSTKPPLLGCYASPAAATLVALLEHGENSSHSPNCSFERLMCTAAEKLEPRMDGSRVAFPSMNDIKENIEYNPVWEHIKQLMSRGLVKERMNKKGALPGECGKVYELLPNGRALATRLRRENSEGGVGDGPMIHSTSSVEEQRANGFLGKVKLLVDFREGGGEHNNLHKMISKLDQHKVPYEVSVRSF